MRVSTPIPPMNDSNPPVNAFTVVRSSDDAALHGAIVAIGNFDGVHRGHRTVIDAARARAKEFDRKAAALTFSPHPAKVPAAAGRAVRAVERAQQAAPACRRRARRRHCHDLRRGAAGDLGGTISSRRFSSAVSASAARRSASISISAKTAPARRSILRQQGRRLGFAVDIVPPLEDEGRPVSSGAVRTALAARARWWKRRSCSARRGLFPAR